MVQCTQPPPQLKLPESKITELTDDENHDSSPKPEKRTRMHHIERHRSCVVTLSDIELNGLQPRRLLQTIEKSQEEDHSVRSMKKHLQILMHHTGMRLQMLLGKPSKGQ